MTGDGGRTLAFLLLSEHLFCARPHFGHFTCIVLCAPHHPLLAVGCRRAVPGPVADLPAVPS